MKRADRLQQLIDDITSTQVQITNSYNVMENAQNKMRAQLDQMMKDNGVDTFPALQDKIKAALSAEDQEKYAKVSVVPLGEQIIGLSIISS